MWKEFKEFAMRGNVLDMAVGIVIGAAFTGIVNSFVSDILMPPLALITGNVNFSDKFVSLSAQQFATLAEAKAAGVPTLNYGVFLDKIIGFVIVAFAVFMLVRMVNRLKRSPEAAPPPPPNTKDCFYCFSAIPIRATRCPACTSRLEANEPQPVA
jgi:large conductance mechanosensitive channel